MTEKTHKIVYLWEKIPYNADKTATIGERIQLAALIKVRDSVFVAVTEAVGRAHGYKPKELDKEFANGLPYSIYIQGTEKECKQHLKDLEKSALGSLKEKVLQHKAFRLLDKKRRALVNKEKDNSLESIKGKLLAVGVVFDVTIEKLK